MRTLMCELAYKYGTDKSAKEDGGWGYTPIYWELFKDWRDSVRRVLEVGICGNRDIVNNRTGASLFLWRDAFPNAEIIGIDNDSRWMVNDEPRIKTFCLDAYKSDLLFKAMVDDIGDEPFDFICDDAVHDPVPQLCLLNDLWPFLRHGGIYAIEDCGPYKLPHGDFGHIQRFFPEHANTKIYETHKDERLIIVR